MRNRCLTLLLAILTPVVARSQNLIVNPGFELFTTCPTGPGQLDGRCDDWYRASVASTDYMNTCGFGSVPARTGEAHLGFLAYDFSADYREYATSMLTDPLTAGQEYKLEMWLILNANRLHAIAEVGALFTATRPSWPGTVPPIGVTPQIVNTRGVLDDKVDWMLISERFIATGGEQWITIGNFFDDANTTVQGFGCCGQFGAYYHLDDLTLIKAAAPESCLFRYDLTNLDPFTPNHATVFMPPTLDGLSLQGPAYQCPINTGDLELDPSVLSNGVPLSFYQVDRATPSLLLVEDVGTIRFEF